MTGTVTLVVEKGDHRAEATIPLGRYILRAEESSNDMYASIDAIVDQDRASDPQVQNPHEPQRQTGQG